MQRQKNNPLKLLFLLSASLISTCMCAQMNYLDFNSEQMEIVLNEEFNNNQNNWPTEGKIENGTLIVNDKLGNYYSPAIAILFILDLKRDFEIETRFLVDKYTYATAILIGQYLWTIDGGTGGIYSFGMKGKSLLNNENSGPVPKNTYNKFTLRKIGGNYLLFINEKFVGITTLESLNPSKQFKIGFWGKTLTVDYLKVSYLLKEDRLFTSNSNSSANRTNNSPDGIKPIKQEIKQGGKYYGLVIGVSKYDESKLNLDKPEKDAQKIKEIFVKRYSFSDSTTFLLSNPTRQKIISELYRLRRIIGPNDNLLIFYAGHGYWDEDAKQGYWWAKDAVPDDPSTWLSNSDLREQIRSIKSAHTLLISDACFSGGIFRTRSGNEIQSATRDIQMLYSMPSRRAITSGTMTAVPDNSVFLEYLLKRLKDNQNKFLSSQNLFDSFRTAVINNSSVVPQDGVIAETGDEGGDFIFILKED